MSKSCWHGHWPVFVLYCLLLLNMFVIRSAAFGSWGKDEGFHCSLRLGDLEWEQGMSAWRSIKTRNTISSSPVLTANCETCLNVFVVRVISHIELVLLFLYIIFGTPIFNWKRSSQLAALVYCPDRPSLIQAFLLQRVNRPWRSL